MSTRAVDSSYDALTREEARCLKEKGWPIFIQCLLALPFTGPERPKAAINNLQIAHEEGLQTGGYIAIGGDYIPASYVDWARRGLPDDLWDALTFVAIDVEVRGIQEQQIWDAVHRLGEYGKYYEAGPSDVGIYTSFNAWWNYVTPANPTSFAERGVWLWNAYWDGKPDVDFATLPFGGWHPDQVALEQWSGGTNVCGQFVDRNTIANPELLNLGGEHMPTPEYEELTKRLDDTQRLLGLYAETQEKGIAEVNIWPVGKVPLRTIRHRGYHAPNLVTRLKDAVAQVQHAAKNHIIQHNQGGGIRDNSSEPYLRAADSILTDLEKEIG